MRVDFSGTDVTPADGYEGCFADHEVNETIITKNYSALETDKALFPIEELIE